MNYQVLTINPGSTSTKVALFEGDKNILSATVRHDGAQFDAFRTIGDQLPYRRMQIQQLLKGHTLHLDAVVGRGGGLLPCEGGVYAIDEGLLHDARTGANGVQHPAQLGPLLAHEFAQQYGCPAFVVNPPDTDELTDEARITGIRNVTRHVHLHALNLKETAIRHAAAQGCRYEEMNLVVCHLGGGVSISAHRKGRMIDGNDIVGGEGPMAPTRCGSIPVMEVLKLLDEGCTTGEIRQRCMKNGGLTSLCGTADVMEVQRLADAGDAQAAAALDAMVYQIMKWIGAMAAVLEGKAEAILIGGGIAHSEQIIARLRDACSWIAPVHAYPGEFEMEAMASGAVRALSGMEICKTYQPSDSRRG